MWKKIINSENESLFLRKLNIQRYEKDKDRMLSAGRIHDGWAALQQH
jgi:hypothetical protein